MASGGRAVAARVAAVAWLTVSSASGAAMAALQPLPSDTALQSHEVDRGGDVAPCEALALADQWTSADRIAVYVRLHREARNGLQDSATAARVPGVDPHRRTNAGLSRRASRTAWSS